LLSKLLFIKFVERYIMEIIDTKLAGCKVIIPKKFSDNRGYFSESWNKVNMAATGIEIDFVQDNHSFSANKGTVRGLHYQAPPYAQDKLVRAAIGSILDIAVDVRLGSPTYGQWVAELLTEENGHQLLVPKGFLHGFITCEDNVHVMYKCSNIYAPEADGGVRFDDPDLAIDWQNEGSAILSDKDEKAISFAEFKSPFTFEG